MQYRIQFEDQTGVIQIYQGAKRGFAPKAETAATYEDHITLKGTLKQCSRWRGFSRGGTFEGMADCLTIADHSTGLPCKFGSLPTTRPGDHLPQMERDLLAVESRWVERVKRDRQIMEANRR